MKMIEKQRSETSVTETNKINTTNLSIKSTNSSNSISSCFSKEKKCSSKILYILIAFIILIIGIIIFLIVRLLINNKNSKDLFNSKSFILNETFFIGNEDNIITNNKNISNNYTSKKIKIGLYSNSLFNEEIQKSTSLFLNYLSKENIFDFYFFTQLKNKNGYNILENVEKIMIDENNTLFSLKDELIKNKIDILIYQDTNVDEINFLNNLEEVKTVIFLYSCSFNLIYSHEYYKYKRLYTILQNSKYIVSLIPVENDYLFNIWGINSTLMNNFISFNYDIIPSDLSHKTIIMKIQSNHKYNNYYLGIKSMKFILEEIPDAKLIIISDSNKVDDLKLLVKELNIEKNINFVNTSNYEIYFKNSSLNIFTSFVEIFPSAITETKLYGIPNIITGIDYTSNCKGGTVIIYDDQPESIAREAIKILKDEKYRKKLGEEARESMKEFKNELTTKKWIELLLSIYNGKDNYNYLRKKQGKISENEANQILRNQAKLINSRVTNLKNINLNNLLDLNYIGDLGNEKNSEI